jgi:hypothetical protein
MSIWGLLPLALAGVLAAYVNDHCAEGTDGPQPLSRVDRLDGQ